MLGDGAIAYISICSAWECETTLVCAHSLRWLVNERSYLRVHFPGIMKEMPILRPLKVCTNQKTFAIIRTWINCLILPSARNCRHRIVTEILKVALGLLVDHCLVLPVSNATLLNGTLLCFVLLWIRGYSDIRQLIRFFCGYLQIHV